MAVSPDPTSASTWLMHVHMPRHILPKHRTALEHMFCTQSYSTLGVGCDCPVSSSPVGEAAAGRQMRKQNIFSDDKATLSNTAKGA